MTKTKETLLKYIGELEAVAEQMMLTESNLVRATPFGQFRAGCLHLVQMLGPSGQHWAPDFGCDDGFVRIASKMRGTLQAIKQAISADLVLSVEDLAMAEAFSDLLEQADYLLAEKYYLAAGVLGRAVLEEHLRRWCARGACIPAKPRPTLADFYSALYKASKLDKIAFKHVEAMAAIGNEAAHNLPTLTQADVGRLLRDVRDFLTRHPIS